MNEQARVQDVNGQTSIPKPFTPVASPINTAIPTSKYGNVTTLRKPESSNGNSAR